MTYALQVGPFPEWIRQLRASGYSNIFQLCQPTCLFGTEHFLGDWTGELLVVAKDFAPAEEVRNLIRQGLSADLVYRHNDGDGRYHTGLRTNRRLAGFLFGDSTLIDGRGARNCKALYISASFLLKEGSTSDSLANWKVGRPAFDGSVRVFDHVVTKMKNLQGIVCLGLEALAMVSTWADFEAPGSLSEATGRRFGDNIPIYVTPHPSRGANTIHRELWSFIRRDTGLAWIGTSYNK